MSHTAGPPNITVLYYHITGYIYTWQNKLSNQTPPRFIISNEWLTCSTKIALPFPRASARIVDQVFGWFFRCIWENGCMNLHHHVARSGTLGPSQADTIFQSPVTVSHTRPTDINYSPMGESPRCPPVPRKKISQVFHHPPTRSR